MKKIKPLQVVQFVLIFIITSIAYSWKGPQLAVLILMIYIDKGLISCLKYQADFGIELQTLSSVLAGIIYGPFFGFIFGFVFWVLIGGLFEFISWLISPPVTPAWVPFVPSPESLVNGLIGSIGGIVGTSIPLLILIVIVGILRNFVMIVKDQFIGWPPKLAYGLNIVFNVILVFAFQFYIDQLLALA